MKISNETKVGSLTAIAIVVLIFGFNFLKGKDLNASHDKLYAVFPSVEGLAVSTPVMINGLQVGKVAALKEIDMNLTGIVVTISMSKEVNIPRNSVALINSELLGGASMKIQLGNGSNYVKDGDTLLSMQAKGMVDKLQASIDPALASVNRTLVSLDTLIMNLNSTLDPRTKNNLQDIIANLMRTTKSLEQLANAQTGILAKSLTNMESVTGNLAKNNEKITATVNNLEKATSQFANADIKGSLEELKGVLSNLETTIGKTTQKDNTLGLLLNDRQLYDEIRETNRSLTTLLDDLRVHPKRYVSISVFGKKDKKGPLMSPIYDTIPK
ncbi:MAG: MlaD family protein [Candidatus Pseudobacter hemicellulosilyticus]|uniref:MlaD family protein n=1 Tax=Candidatus Pseudobacter hemicellulosilyticus TaxID=3121375 RepID=A0AAJ5WPW6_9BACT|nr:MAG: MlaD family protein [Pseudobacter sp.]